MPVNGVRRDEPLGVHATEALPLLIEWAAGTGTTVLGTSRNHAAQETTTGARPETGSTNGANFQPPEQRSKP